ncbi:ATPase, AAA-type, core,Cell division protein Cdc6/18,P-loop containing nucleoside triphosphate [Cinara cedri]|uniref:ATPase, AAA-type, core,Cell division protein Cdc6/18,P-loop containing nucleoside triphosphate n=1 Tax=Cinara cedri TaxID=506608 RepID=A0A5E4NN07_9HEMI|nr:ATPase, AAA-type, core,Cell division protein Cdc6/18,P-loop containing nucleoside triphosphate [Cinara cedri]
MACNQKSFFNSALLNLHSGFTDSLPGREVQIECLKSFLMKHIEDNVSASMYVSGPPGTGKTVSLHSLFASHIVTKNFLIAYVNCSMIKSANHVYAKIAEILKLNCIIQRECILAIERFLKTKHQSILLVLDEIDQLSSKNQSILYKIFEWPTIPQSKLVVIGIANSLDLTDRLLPMLKTNVSLQPQLLNFPPYTKTELANIINHRLEYAGVVEIFPANAIQLLAAKIASFRGDVRYALDVTRRVIELADEKVDKKITLNDVMTVLNNVYSTSGALDNNDENTEKLPLQQELVVCALLLILSSSKKNQVITIGNLFDVFKKICTKRNIQVRDLSEFITMCSLIETRGIIKIQGQSVNRLSKIILLWDKHEVDDVLHDKQLLVEILNDKSFLK